MSSAANSPARTSRLSSRREVAERTMAFEFEKPPGFEFKAGQYAEVAWLDPDETDAEGTSRAFSIASAPHEPSLLFTTRLRDTAFKRILKKAPIGTLAKIDGPFGDLTLHNNAKRPAVFLAGGIGITPFRSMIRHAAHAKLPHRLYLFYANRRPQDAPYLDELAGIEREYANFTLVPTMTDETGSDRTWTGETGQFSADMLKRHLNLDLSGAEGPRYYVAGPPGMVHGVRTMLNGAGVDDDEIRTEEFEGY